MKTAVQSRRGDQPSIPLELQSVSDLLACLAQALKQMQFYGLGSSGAQRALEAARIVFEAVWAETDRLQCTVRANAFEVEGCVVYEGGDLSDSLPFLFYKDGIRDLIFLPGFEREELGTFLETLGRARSVRLDDDDLVTLLWERDLAYLRYGYVDATADVATGTKPGAATGSIGSAVPGATDDVFVRDGSGGDSDPALQANVASTETAIVRRISERALAAEAQPRGEWDDPARLQGPRPSAAVAAAACNTALVALDPVEMATIQRDIDAELARDVEQDVLLALLDSLEDAPEPKQSEILFILSNFLPALVNARRLDLAVSAIADLHALRDSGRIGPVHADTLTQVTNGPQMATAVEALLAALQSGDCVPHAATLGRLLTCVGALSFEALIRSSETVKSNEIRATLQAAVGAVMAAQPAASHAALSSTDVVVLRAVLRAMQQTPDAGHGRRVAKFLHHDDPGVREAAIRVVVVNGGRDGIPTLRRALTDTSAEVRTAALWGLGTWRASEMQGELEARIHDRELLEAPAVERLALFEAYARACTSDAVPLLVRVLRGRSALGRRWPSELRQCAARVLLLAGGSAVREVLAKASQDDDDGVRRAAQRALQRLEAAS